MLYGNLNLKTLYCISTSDDLLMMLRNSNLRDINTFDYVHEPDIWTKKDGTSVFSLAAGILGSECLFGTWMSITKTLNPIQFVGIDGYVIGELNGRYLVASSIALYSGTKTSIFK